VLHYRHNQLYLNGKPIAQCSLVEIYQDSLRHLKEFHQDMDDEPPYSNCPICPLYQQAFDERATT